LVWRNLRIFIHRYVTGGFGWQAIIEPQILANKEDGTQFAKDIVSTIPKLFSRHKTYIKRPNYFITVLPLKGILWPLLLLYLPFALIHELTHAFAIRYSTSLRTIMLLPLITEIPFLAIAFLLPLPLYLAIPFALFGMTGIMSVEGDGGSFLNVKKILNMKLTLKVKGMEAWS